MSGGAMVPAMKKSVRPTKVTAQERERGALSEDQQRGGLLAWLVLLTSRLVFI
jgi:hypothetical protein